VDLDEVRGTCPGVRAGGRRRDREGDEAASTGHHRRRRGFAGRRALRFTGDLVQTVPREDVRVRVEARRIVRDLDAAIANGDGLQSTSPDRRQVVIADAIHECANEIETGRLDGVAERPR
jgi:hypothetical protein